MRTWSLYTAVSMHLQVRHKVQRSRTTPVPVRWKDRANVVVKVSGSNGVFPILYVDVHKEADRNAALDSWDNKLSHGTQYAGFRLKDL